MRTIFTLAVILIMCIGPSMVYANEPVEHYNVDRNYHYLSAEELDRMLFGPHSRNEENRNQFLMIEARNSEDDLCRVSAKPAFARKILARPTARALCLTK
jgi:hypothetical protein